MMDHGTSISEEGSEDYVSRLEAVGREYPEMLVLPGVEAILFFYWKGDLWDGTLTLARGNEHIDGHRPRKSGGLRWPTVRREPDLSTYIALLPTESLAADPDLPRLSAFQVFGPSRGRVVLNTGIPPPPGGGPVSTSQSSLPVSQVRPVSRLPGDRTVPGSDRLCAFPGCPHVLGPSRGRAERRGPEHSDL